MLKTFTQSEMLNYWKRRLGLKASPALAGLDDMTDLDMKLLSDIDLWYEEILAEAPADKLPVDDVADEASARYISDNAAEITPPERGVRLVALRMGDWSADEVESFSAYSDIARLQRNRLTRATIDEPVVVRRNGRLEAHGLVSAPKFDSSGSTAEPPMSLLPVVSRLEMVVRPPEGKYTLDTTLLRNSTLPIH